MNNDIPTWQILVHDLRVLAKYKRISYQEIAEKTGLKPSNVSRFFSGNVEPKVSTLILIAWAVWCDIKIIDNQK